MLWPTTLQTTDFKPDGAKYRLHYFICHKSGFITRSSGSNSFFSPLVFENRHGVSTLFRSSLLSNQSSTAVRLFDPPETDLHTAEGSNVLKVQVDTITGLVVVLVSSYFLQQPFPNFSMTWPSLKWEDLNTGDFTRAHVLCMVQQTFNKRGDLKTASSPRVNVMNSFRVGK